MKAKYFLFFAVMIVSGLPLRAQSGAVFAPFVSGFAGEVKNNLVRLSWTDSKDVRGPVHLYRSAAPFDMAGSPGTEASRLAVIPYGTQSYVDEIETSGTFYYFAAASDESGTSYNVPIEFTNTVQIEAAGIAVSVPASGDTFSPKTISALEAVVRENRVIISFEAESEQNLTLYRSMRPIAQTQDLLGAMIIQTKISSPFTDNPVPGIPYYYAVVAEEDLIRGTVEIIPGSNATQSPVTTASGPGTEARELRPIPLPLITAQSAVTGTGVSAGIPPAGELSPGASKAVEAIPPRPETGRTLKRPRVFARDLEPVQAGGEDYALNSIIRGSFSAKNWVSAKNELDDFLALPRSPEFTARAKFYLGQCCYFLDRPRDALFEFLAIQERYPAEAAEWIQAVLAIMKD